MTVLVGPTLRTDRLVLDMHRPADFEESAALWDDADVTRLIGGVASSRTESWARILRHAGSWSLLGFGYWAVREAASGRFVGQVGFADPRRDIEPLLDGIPEAGWVLSSWSHGRGYATEAMRAAVAWADANLAHAETVCLIDPRNAASFRVAEKCGYAVWRRGVLGDGETMILRRARGG